MKRLRYGNTNTFYIPGDPGGLLVDTDYAGSLQQFFRAIKAAGISTRDISHLLITHYHPDHCGLAGDLQELGVKLVIVDHQLDWVHYSDGIFRRDGLPFKPVDVDCAQVITCEESRAFLASMGLSGELIHTPSHSADSISLILDDGDCIVGDLEPMEYLAAYEQNPALERDWEQILRHQPRRIRYAHANEKMIKGN